MTFKEPSEGGKHTRTHAISDRLIVSRGALDLDFQSQFHLNSPIISLMIVQSSYAYLL